MSEYGFRAYNTAGKLLITTETLNLHYLGQAVLTSVPTASTGFGGMYRGIYTVTCIGYPMPFFSYTPHRTGVTSINNVGLNTWNIEVITSGITSIPKVYIFSNVDSCPKIGTYGLKVLRNDNSTAFDSRATPLTVAGIGTVAPPSNPRVGAISGSARYCESGDISSLAPDNSTNFSIPFDIISNNPIFYYGSLAQAEREATFTDSDGANYIFYKWRKDWLSTYWCFYRSGIEWIGANIFTCGWIPVAGGCVSDYRSRSSFFFGLIDWSDSHALSGNWPYSNETANIADSVLLVADGDLYI